MGHALLFVRAAMERNVLSSTVVAKWAVQRVIIEDGDSDVTADGAMVSMFDYDAVLMTVNYILNQVRISSTALRAISAEASMDTEEEARMPATVDMSGAVTNIVGGRTPVKVPNGDDVDDADKDDGENNEENNKGDDGKDNDNNEVDTLETSGVDEQVLDKLVASTKTAIDEAKMIYNIIVPR